MGNDNVRKWVNWTELNETTEWLYEKSRKNLKRVREEIGLNQAEFAKALGVSRAALSYYENGTRTPDIRFIIKVGVLTECNYDYLLGDSPTMKGKQKYDVAKALDLAEQEAEQLRSLCEFHPIFRALLTSGKLREISSKLKYSAEDIIAGREDYDRIVWECMKDVEQLFRGMLDASIAEARTYLDEDESDNAFEDDEDICEEVMSSTDTNPFQVFRERMARVGED